MVTHLIERGDIGASLSELINLTKIGAFLANESKQRGLHHISPGPVLQRLSGIRCVDRRYFYDRLEDKREGLYRQFSINILPANHEEKNVAGGAYIYRPQNNANR